MASTELRAAAQQALEAMEVATNCLDGYYIPRGKTTLPEIEDAITALKAALAEPAQEPGPEPWERRVALAEQEPVARVRVNSNVPGRINELDLLRPLPRGEHFLYTAPPQRKPLTEEEIMQCFDEAVADYVDVSDAEMVDFARAIERAHGIGGEG